MIEPMVRRVNWKDGKFGLALFSDLHLGARDCDEKKLKRDMETACSEDRRILINGDVADAILPRDMKRYVPSLAMSDRDDVLNEITDYAYHFLRPYADYIDLIGTGNHEESPLKYSSYDIIGAIVVMLNRDKSKSLPKIHRAAYQGYAQYRINDGNNRNTDKLTIYHHHGAGGSAPVSKGMIDINRIVYSHDADIWWIGHKHVGTHDPYIVRDGLSPQGKYITKVGQAVFTPGYKMSTNLDKDNHVRIHYSDKFYSLQPQGYAIVDIFEDKHTRRINRFEVVSR